MTSGTGGQIRSVLQDGIVFLEGNIKQSANRIATIDSLEVTLNSIQVSLPFLKEADSS